ncbi:methyltransferase family protein [Actinomadura welshii]
MNDRSLTLAPRLLWAVGAGVLAAGIVRRAGEGGAPAAAAAVMLAAYLGWLLLEAPVTFRRAAAAPADARTLLPYALARILLVASASFGPPPAPAAALSTAVFAAASAGMFAAGVVLRRAAIRTLGRFYSHHVVRYDGHRVVTSGLYRIVRHPAYAGMLLANTGFALFFRSPAVAAALLLLAAAVAWRIRVEERALMDVPGYARYAAGTPRLVPGVW